MLVVDLDLLWGKHGVSLQDLDGQEGLESGPRSTLSDLHSEIVSGD